MAEAMDVLRTEFRGKLPDPIGMQRSKWGANEFAQGTISHLAPHGSPEDFRALGRPVGRLRFGGDSTCPELNRRSSVRMVGIREAVQLAGELLFSSKDQGGLQALDVSAAHGASH